MVFVIKISDWGLSLIFAPGLFICIAVLTREELMNTVKLIMSIVMGRGMLTEKTDSFIYIS